MAKSRWIQIHEELWAQWTDTGDHVAAAACKLAAQQEQRIAALEALVVELADDLEAEVRSNYVHSGSIHPADARRLERDMEPVERARKALGGSDA